LARVIALIVGFRIIFLGMVNYPIEYVFNGLTPQRSVIYCDVFDTGDGLLIPGVDPEVGVVAVD
jgi:hypothetical protein